MKTHPVAALFPMLDEERLTAMAEDIKQHGLIHPIVLDKEGQVLDGRNRLAACERAGIAPSYETWAGEDSNGYALAANLLRRDLTQGAKAVIAALAEKSHPGGMTSNNDYGTRIGVGEETMRRARTVVAWLPESVPTVLAGASLEDAYQRAMLVRSQREPSAKAIERIQQHVETIGVPVPIRPTPNLEVAGTADEDDYAPRSSANDAEQLRAQARLLTRLIDVRKTLQALAEEPPLLEGWAPLLQVGAVRSAISHIVDLAYAIAEKYNTAIEETNSIRSIK